MFYGTLRFTAKADDWEIFLHFPCANEQQAKSIEKQRKKMKSKMFIQNMKKYPEMIAKLRAKYSIDG